MPWWLPGLGSYPKSWRCPKSWGLPPVIIQSSWPWLSIEAHFLTWGFSLRNHQVDPRNPWWNVLDIFMFDLLLDCIQYQKGWILIHGIVPCLLTRSKVRGTHSDFFGGSLGRVSPSLQQGVQESVTLLNYTKPYVWHHSIVYGWWKRFSPWERTKFGELAPKTCGVVQIHHRLCTPWEMTKWQLKMK